MLLIIQHLKNYLISFGSVFAQLDWAIQKKLDYPVKRLCRNYLKCEFVILNPSQCVILSPSYHVILRRSRRISLRINSAKNLNAPLRVTSVKNLTKSMRYKTEILRLGPQNDNCDTVSKPDNDKHWNRVRYE